MTHCDAEVLGFLSNIETFEFDWALYDPDTPRSTLKQFALEFTQNQPADFLDFLMHSYLWTAPPRRLHRSDKR